MNHYTEEELIAELISRRKKENKDIIILLADDEVEDLHIHSPLDSACRMAALLFSALITMLSQQFNLTTVQGRELLYESLNSLLTERLNFYGKKTSEGIIIQKNH